MDAKFELSSRALHSDVVRVTLPVNVANNLDLLTNLLKDLGGRLGCKGCISGAACFFETERDFVVNEKGLINR